MAETSLGEGIGLQQGANRDDFWAKQIYARGVAKKAEREKADQDLIQASDFKLDYSNKLPVYAKKMAEVQRDVMNKVAVARQANRNTARSVVADDLYKAQLELGKLEQDNARAMAYIADDKTRKDSAVINTLTSPDSTFEDIASIHDGQFFMTDATGTFAYKPVPLDYAAPKFDKYSQEGYPTGRYKIQGHGRYDELQYGYSKGNIEAEINQLANDRKFQENVWFETRQVPTPEGADPIQFKQTLVNKKAEEVVMNSIPKGKIEWKRNELYERPQGSASDRPKPEAIVNPPTKMTVTEFSREGTPVGKKSTVEVPFSSNVQNTKPVEVPISRQIFDATTNRPLGGSGTITIKPTTVIPVKKNNGQWENMVIGKAVKSNSAEGESPMTYGDKYTVEEIMVLQNLSKKDAEDKLKQEINLQIPYDAVKGTIESAHSMGDYFKRFDELKKEKTSGGASYEIKGKKYSEQDLIKMGYTPEQIAPYKK